MEFPIILRSTSDRTMQYTACTTLFATTRKLLNEVMLKVPDSRIDQESYVAIRDHGTGLWVLLTSTPVEFDQELKDQVQLYFDGTVELLTEAINADKAVRD